MQVIRKESTRTSKVPNLVDYTATCDAFTWERAGEDITGLAAGAGVNIAFETVARHASGPRRDQTALRCLDRDERAHDLTYADVQALTNRFANVLRRLGVDPGDTVCTLLSRVPELYVTAIGTWKNQSVLCPLFSAFGPEPIFTRLSIGNARVLVTTTQLYRRKVENLRASLPGLEHVLLIRDATDALPAGAQDFQLLMDSADDHFDIAPTEPETAALLHFTSGTTGKPKGAVHVHAAVVAHHATAKFALDLQPDDVFWCTADPGWVTGVVYGIVAPLSIGATLIVEAGEFDSERWFRILQDQKVDVWYTSPTAVRMMMRIGANVARQYDVTALRFIASVGEPLNPDAVVWGQEAFGLPIHDNWWQTETGAIMIANFRSMDIKPGSMGRPVPGVEAAIVRHNERGGVDLVRDADVEGELALRSGWPSMFRSYLGQEERYRKSFAQGWYLTGDLARRDKDGYFWFIGRSDDVIKSAGHLIGPFEVESALREHPAVLDVGVIGKPDPLLGEIVKAFVVIKPGYETDSALHRDLLAHARKRLGAAVAPREIDFRPALPVTRSGKIMRRLLKARELGLPEGDVSTLLDAE